MKKIIKIVFAIAFTLGISSCSNTEKQAQAGPANALAVDAYLVLAQSFNNELVTTANLMAEEQVELRAPMTGQVLAIYFKEGETVRKGQTLIRLDDRVWKAQLTGVKAELDAAQRDLDRKKQLLVVEGSSQEEVDNALSKVALLKSQLEQLQVNIDLANVSAPFSGQLGMRDFSEGAFLKQGDLITTLSAGNQLKVDFTIAQAYAKSIALNKPIDVLIGGETFKATVYAINPIINAENRTLNIRAIFKQNATNRIKPGTFAEVLIATDMIDNAILIPTQAVVPSINEQTVYIIKKGKAVRKVIKMGDRNANDVLVLEGISVGDTVVTTGLLQIKEGMDLTIQSIK